MYDNAILMRVGKSWRNYRFKLREDYFHVKNKTIDQIYESKPDGISRESWLWLVDYWKSDDFKKLSEVGKVARASIDHIHTCGSTSFADRRLDLEEKLKREPSELEVFVDTHAQQKGGFVKDTTTSHFVDIAKFKVQEQLANGSSESEVVIENQVFDNLMFQGAIPKRPVNYGYGVKRSDVYGVHGILRKEAKTSTSVRVGNENAEIEKLKKQIEESNAKHKETDEVIKMLVTQMMRNNGSSSSQVLEGAESALHVLSSQDLNQKAKELQAKEAELRKREEALQLKEAAAKGVLTKAQQQLLNQQERDHVLSQFKIAKGNKFSK